MILFANNATSTVAGSIAPTGTQVAVASGHGALFPNPVAPDYFIATFYKNDGSGRHEIVHVTARNGDTMTIVRAQENTAADQWNPGDTFSNLVTAGALGQVLQLSQGDVQEAPVNGKPYARELAAWTNAPFAPYVPPTWPPASWPKGSMVYTGHDSGAKNALAVPLVKPALSTALVEGMMFTVKVLNANDGPCTMSVQGGAAHPVKMMDGLAVEAGKLTAGNMMLFWFDGASFVAMVHKIDVPPPIVVPPPSPPDVYVPPVYVDNPPPSDFYVDPVRGDDSIKLRDGLSPQKAWKTLNGAARNIEGYYASRPAVRVHCAPGACGPLKISGSHCPNWRFISDNLYDAIIAPEDIGVDISNAKVSIEGFVFETGFEAVKARAGAIVRLVDCLIRRPKHYGYCPVVATQGGIVYFIGDIVYDCRDSTVHNCFFECDSGLGYLGYEIEKLLCHISFQSSSPTTSECHFNYGTIWAHNGATIYPWHDGCSFSGANSVRGPRFRCETAGGFAEMYGDWHFFPGDQEGFCDGKTYGWYSP